MSLILIFSTSCKESSKEVKEDIPISTTEVLVEKDTTVTQVSPSSELNDNKEETIISTASLNLPEDSSNDEVIEEAEASVFSPNNAINETASEKDAVIVESTAQPSSPVVEKIMEVSDVTPKEVESLENGSVEEVKPVITELKTQSSGLHDGFDALLKKYVSSTGKVDYAGMATEIGALDAYLADLSSVKLSELSSSDEKLAFWINAYNAFTIKLILKNYPVKSITDLHDGKPWDVKWIALDSRTLSLNNIENDIIRPTFKDARIHFAVNCAAKSCPPLLNRAYQASYLNETLESQTKKFVNNSDYNSISTTAIKISKIFDWYAVDFGDINAYINQYTSTDVSNSKVSYQEYNWQLNN